MNIQTSKLLTLVVPTYNMEKYLSRCLESVTDPCIPDTLEVIVVNDGSKDRSLEIMNDFAARRPDIVKVINKGNGHYGSCVNAGLKIATGKYFRMLDADDWMDTAALKELLKRLENCDTDLFLTLRTEYRYDKGKNQVIRYPFKTIEYNKVYEMQNFDITAHAQKREFNMHSMAYKTEILRKVGLKHIEGICYTDLQYCFLPIDRIKDFIIFDLYLYNYVIGREEQSTSAASLARNLPHISKVVNFMFNYLNENKPSGKYTLKNQHYFLLEAIEIYIISLRMQKSVKTNEYPEILKVMENINKHNIHSRILNKLYFRPWKYSKSRKVLNITLAVYHKIHFRRFRKMGI